jgi:hypothetical protein
VVATPSLTIECYDRVNATIARSFADDPERLEASKE